MRRETFIIPTSLERCSWWLAIAGLLLIAFCTEQVASGLDDLANSQAMPTARAGALRAEPQASQAKPLIAIAGEH